jgi:hypothetical protein
MKTYNKLEEALKDEDYLSGNWYRIIRNVSGLYVVETIDLGHICCGQSLIKINPKKYR